MLAAAPPSDRPRRLRFGVFEVDLETGELRKRGVRLRLHDQPFQVLSALLQTPGEMVSREELRRRLWPDTAFGDFDGNLNSAVRKLRHALGDSAENPRFVETLPRRGYRFIAPVDPISDPSSGASLPLPENSRAGRRLSKAGWTAVLFAAMGAVLLGLFAAGRPLAEVLRGRDDRGDVPQQGAGSGPGLGRKMLAVLPFDNLDGDPDRDFFCDGLTEEMIAQLGRLDPERLGVVARTSSSLYKGSEKGVREIGRELGVDVLLEGSVRTDGSAARITAQLIQVSDQSHLWSETYDTELTDLLEVQGEVAVEVARVLALELLPDRPLALARAGTRVTEAYEAFLRGRHEWNRFTDEGHRLAVGHFRQATELDPAFAAAWAGLANAYNLQSFSREVRPAEVFPRAREAAETALRLEGRLAEAHAALAFVRLYFDYDPASAEEEFQRAVELRPSYAMAFHWRAGALSALKRHDQAIEAMQRALELDPLSLSVQSDAGWYYLFAGRRDEAAAECRRTLESAEYGWARSCLVEVEAEAGRFDRALELLGPSLGQELQNDPRWQEVLAVEDPKAAFLAARRLQLADRLRRDPEHRQPVSLAILQAAVGDLDAAFDSLERAFELRDAWLVFLDVDPRFAPLREDPRIGELLERVRLSPF
ncbi:MAG: winged helix-turn-helix domain-containing protein [Acidobacteria bacterium]|nr:winged helix-turn-helix domain-containing protein [Acidobacteriota bacterium]